MTDMLTRDELLRRGGAAAALLALPSFLAACGGGSKTEGATTTAAKELGKELDFSNYTLYIDIDEKTKKRPSLEEFEQKTGVHVNYFEDVNSNDQYFGKIQGPLSRGQSVDRDI